MASIAEMEVRIQGLTRDDEYVLTREEELDRLNRVNRYMAGLGKFAEFRRSDESVTTTDGTNEVSMPASPVFSDLTLVEVADPEDGNKLHEVPFAMDEMRHGQAMRAEDGFPESVVRSHDGSSNQLQFAPAPDFAGTVRLTGYVEPDEIDNVSVTTTPYYSEMADDALAHLVAADVQFEREFRGQGEYLLRRASAGLSDYLGREISPAELAAGLGLGG